MPDWLPHTVNDVVAFPPIRIAFLIIVALVVRKVVIKLIDRTVRQAVRERPKFRRGSGSGHPAGRPDDAVAADPHPGGSNGSNGGSNGNHNGGRREQRLTALGSLGKSIVTVIIVFVSAVMVLAELGFNITSVIAGTSIVGVTIAFGLQNVVKDFAAGVFILIEDQLGVGDVVDMKEAFGTVESIGLRVTQLRGDDGTVWYVRNGEMVRIGNYSQGGPGYKPDPVPETVKVQLQPPA